MSQNYPELRQHLRQVSGQMRRQSPQVMDAMMQLHAAAMGEGVLSVKQKELIALGISIAVRCEGCIAFHTYEALAAGASPDEIADCIGVAIQMGGGPAVVYGAKATEALQQFQAAEAQAHVSSPYTEPMPQERW